MPTPASFHTSDELLGDELLGLTKGMDLASRRSRLTALYMQFNSQVTHENPDVRKNAEMMLMKIAEASRRDLGIGEPQRRSRGRLSIRGLLERIGWLSRN